MKKFDSINIIPFVDIMLVLLAIVLTTFTLEEKKLIPIEAPNSKKANGMLKKDDITITITKEGLIFWKNKKILDSELLNKVSSIKKDDVVVINCDKDAKFNSFIYVLDILKQKDIRNISIVTKNE